ncbi:MAG: sulfite exporter TauE/SafE family protein [Planctomycetota bacterium]
MITLLVSVFVASLLGSLHCAGMCGGLVAFYSGGARTAWSRHQSHGCYSLGRLLAYSALGAVAGALGASLDFAGSFAGMQRLASVVAGLLIIGWGVTAFFPSQVNRVLHGLAPRWLTTFVSGRVARVRTTSPPLRAFVIGALSAFLPCGWLYAFAIVAAGTGSVLSGAVVMIAFWGGTLPILLGLGYGVHRLAQPLGKHVPRLSAAVLVLLGCLTVFGRLDAIGVAPPNVGDAQQTPLVALEHVKGIEADDLPCCAND